MKLKANEIRRLYKGYIFDFIGNCRSSFDVVKHVFAMNLPETLLGCLVDAFKHLHDDRYPDMALEEIHNTSHGVFFYLKLDDNYHANVPLKLFMDIIKGREGILGTHSPERIRTGPPLPNGEFVAKGDDVWVVDLEKFDKIKDDNKPLKNEYGTDHIIDKDETRYDDPPF
jgi:hypothetical protein